MEKITNCPVCNSTDIKDSLKVKDHSITQETFQLSQCTRCSLIFTNPRPEESEIGKYYQSDEYISHSDTKTGLINALYHKVRNITLQGKLNLINQIRPSKGKILDIGCGTGYFLNTCKNNGWKIFGTEPDANARNTAENITGEKIHSAPEEIIREEVKFDVITLWHVLEHVHELSRMMEIIRKLLIKNGSLIIALPNCDSHDAKLYGSYWAAYDVPRHLYHFKPEAVKTLLENHNFNLTQIKPMKFDSFYVSMLSEKYKNQSSSITGLGKAFFNGLRSNRKGRKTGNYSSLIYVAEKKD